jgi:hypothetical protein
MKRICTESTLPIAAVLLAAVLAGCASSSPDVFRDQTMDFAAIRTVAVMPLSNQTREAQAPERVRDVFMTLLLSTGAVYVVPPGEVSRGISRTGLSEASSPAPEDIIKFGAAIKADAVITGVIREYGEIRSGTTSANVISIGFRMIETQTGRVIWSASSTQGGVTFKDRLLGGSGAPLNEVTEKAINEIIDKMFNAI